MANIRGQDNSASFLSIYPLLQSPTICVPTQIGYRSTSHTPSSWQLLAWAIESEHIWASYSMSWEPQYLIEIANGGDSHFWLLQGLQSTVVREAWHSSSVCGNRSVGQRAHHIKTWSKTGCHPLVSCFLGKPRLPKDQQSPQTAPGAPEEDFKTQAGTIVTKTTLKSNCFLSM